MSGLGLQSCQQEGLSRFTDVKCKSDREKVAASEKKVQRKSKESPEKDVQGREKHPNKRQVKGRHQNSGMSRANWIKRKWASDKDGMRKKCQGERNPTDENQAVGFRSCRLSLSDKFPLLETSVARLAWALLVYAKTYLELGPKSPFCYLYIAWAHLHGSTDTSQQWQL